MPTEIEGIREGQLDSLYTTTQVGPFTVAPGVGLSGSPTPMRARAYKKGRFSWIDVVPPGGAPMRITHKLGADISKPPWACQRGLAGLEGRGRSRCARGALSGLGDATRPVPPTLARNPIPKDRTAGLRIIIRSVGPRVSKVTYDNMLLNLAGKLQYAVLPQLSTIVRDDNPVWTWRSVGPGQFEAVVGSGPFAGHTGEFVDVGENGGAPSAQDTANLPKNIQQYSGVLRPSDQNLSDGKIALMRDQMRQTLRATRVQGATNRVGFEVVPVAPETADKPKAGLGWAAALAAIAGTVLVSR